MAQPIDPTRVISGNYGYVYDETGRWLANVTSFNAAYDYAKEDVPRAGTRRVGKKTMTIEGTGSMMFHKVSSYFIDKVLSATANESAPFLTELNVKLEDPENGGTERWRIKGVQFDNAPLINFEVGSLMEEEYNFTFDDHELVERIEE